MAAWTDGQSLLPDEAVTEALCVAQAPIGRANPQPPEAKSGTPSGSTAAAHVRSRVHTNPARREGREMRPFVTTSVSITRRAIGARQ